MYASEWFSTVFSYNFPLEYTARIWDVFLLEGVDYLLNICLALLFVSQGSPVKFTIFFQRASNYLYCAAELLKLKFEKIILFLKDRGQNIVVNEDFFGLCDSFPVATILQHMANKETHLKEQIQLHKQQDPTTQIFVRRRRASSTNFEDLNGLSQLSLSDSSPDSSPQGSAPPSPSTNNTPPIPISPRQSTKRSSPPNGPSADAATSASPVPNK